MILSLSIMLTMLEKTVRNWMLITSVATAVGVGGLVYYVFPRTSPDAPGMAPQIVVQPEQRSGNPLLTATNEQFGRWFPTHCQADLYYLPTDSQHTRDVCVFNIVKRVEASTGVRLTQENIFDPEVLQHWKQIKGVK